MMTDIQRIAMDVRMLGASGIGTYIAHLLSEFVRIEHKFSFTLIGDAQKIRSVIGDSEKFSIVDTNVPVFSLSEQLRLPGLSNGATLLHSPHHNVPILWSGKLVVTFHDALHWDYPEMLPNWKGKLYLNAVARKIARADAVIVPSNFTAERLIANIGVPKEKIYIIHQGVDRHQFSKRPADSVQNVLKKYGLKPGEYLLYVGNMKPHKNIQRMVDAYNIARRRGLKTKFALAGKIKGLRKTVEIEKLKSHTGVKYIGVIPFIDLPYLYCGARAFLFASLYEGFGLPPLEAMSCGCPVLVSDSASLPEVVGEAGLIVNPYETESIADGIMKIALDLEFRKSLIIKGLERSKHFSWLNTARKTLAVYEKVVNPADEKVCHRVNE